MNKTSKEQLIEKIFEQYSLNSYQKACIMKVIDGCLDLVTYQTGSKGLALKDVDTLAGLIKGHIVNILNVLDIKQNGKRRFTQAQG